MMREVIDNGNAVYFTTHFATAFDALEILERIIDRFAICAPGRGGNDRRQTVPHVKVSDQRCLKVLPLRTVAEYAEVRQAFSKADVACLPFRIFAGAECFELREELFAKRSHDLAQMRTVPTGDQPAISRHQIHQTSKCELHGVQIFVNIRMIEFDVVDEDRKSVV